jgi:hypothetical protein
MRAAVILAIIAAFVSHPAPSYVVRHAAVPEPLRGTWAATGEDCKNADKSTVISEKMYVDPDRSCSVLWVAETAAARGSTYSAHMQCSSPATGSQKSINDLVMQANDANHLSMGPDFSKLKVVHRCTAQ